ncbi:hypothetical protein CYMTET_30973, partial [Cymbomonas tetramitiformis]
STAITPPHHVDMEYKCPLEEASEAACRVHRWTGLIAPTQIMQAVEKCKGWISDGSTPWAVVNVWGFADTPVAWGSTEHGFTSGGENDYSVLLLPGDQYISFCATE